MTEASNSVTFDGKLKFTPDELIYLQSFLTSGDRGGYYMALYNMTGSHEALLQAEISTFSEGAGGAAYLANHLLREFHQSEYLPDIADDTAAIYRASQEVALSSFDAIQNHMSDTGTGYITDSEMLKSASDAWRNLGMPQLFPGNLLLAQEQLINWLAQRNVLLPTPEGALTYLVNAMIEIENDNDTSINNFLSKFTSTGSFYAVMAAIGGAPLMGKQLSDFEGLSQYTITELPDAAYKVAIDNTTHHVAGVFQFEFIPSGLASIEALLAQYWSQIGATIVGGLPAGITVSVIMNYLSQNLAGIRRTHVDNNVFPDLAYPLQNSPENNNETLWGTGGIIGPLHADNVTGGSSDDRIFGGDGGDAIVGGSGKDLLYGQDGDDHLDGGANDDVLRGGNDDDELHGGAGNDLLDGDGLNPSDIGDDTLYGDAGNDTLVGGAGTDHLNGGDNNDTLNGIDGAVTDVLIGGQGDDTYYIDVIGENSDTVMEADDGGLDTVKVSGSYTISNVNIERVQLLEGVQGTNENNFGPAHSSWSGLTVVTVGMGGGKLTGNSGNNELVGNSAGNTLIGDAGNDTLTGGKGLDLLDGGEGNDIYYFERGDALGTGAFGVGDKIIDIDMGAGNDVDTVRFSADISPDDVRYYFDSENFYLNIPSTGDVISMPWRAVESMNNLVDSIGGWNSFVAMGHEYGYLNSFYGGYMMMHTNAIQDSTYRIGFNYNVGGGEDFEWVENGYQYWLGIGAGTDFVHFPSQYYSRYRDLSVADHARQGSIISSEMPDYYAVEKVEFADGTVWDISALGTSGILMNYLRDDYFSIPIPDDWNSGGVQVAATDDIFEGQETNDSISTGPGNDVLNGRGGNDYLNGGSGSDLYLFARGDGHDVITDYESRFANIDIIRFAYDIDPSDLIAYRDAKNLYLKVANTNDSIVSAAPTTPLALAT